LTKDKGPEALPNLVFNNILPLYPLFYNIYPEVSSANSLEEHFNLPAKE